MAVLVIAVEPVQTARRADVFAVPAPLLSRRVLVRSGGQGELEIVVLHVGMLLCLSSRRRRVFQEPVEASGEVALEAAGGLAAALPFLDPALDVVDGRSVRSASGNDDLVEGSV
jgi:hypothetical protein